MLCFVAEIKINECLISSGGPAISFFCVVKASFGVFCLLDAVRCRKDNFKKFSHHAVRFLFLSYRYREGYKFREVMGDAY